MAKKIGTLIKEARTQAGLTQDALAKKITGLSASDISKAERGETELSQDMLKKIAKACGVTQASLLNAAKEPAKKTVKKAAAKEPAEKKTTTAKKTATTSKSASSAGLKLTAAEKELVELYRKAEAEDKEKVMKILKGEKSLLEILGELLT